MIRLDGSVWYRNAGHGMKYHAARPDWIRSGKGACGRDIRRPGFTLRFDDAFRQASRSMGQSPAASLCKDCLTRIGEPIPK